MLGLRLIEVATHALDDAIGSADERGLAVVVVGEPLPGHTLWRGLARQGVYTAQPGWGALLARVLLANAVMAALLIWMGGSLQGWLEMPALARAGRLALCIAVGAASYFAVLYVAGTRLRHLRNVAGA